MPPNGLLLHSIGEFEELIFACLSAANVSSMVEIGLGEGEFTRKLAAWIAERDGSLICIDTCLPAAVAQLAETSRVMKLLQGRSCDVLPGLDPADAYIVDGDHNYYTVSRELRAIRNSSNGGPFPLVFLHDVAGPWARRDSYFDPQTIPGSALHAYDHASEMIMAADLDFGEEGRRRLMGSGYAAISEGGPGNGVLTAVEDFLAETVGLECLTIPCIFGLGILVDSKAAFASDIKSLLNPLLHPLLARLERNRLDLFEAYVTWRLRASR